MGFAQTYKTDGRHLGFLHPVKHYGHIKVKIRMNNGKAEIYLRHTALKVAGETFTEAPKLNGSVEIHQVRDTETHYAEGASHLDSNL